MLFYISHLSYKRIISDFILLFLRKTIKHTRSKRHFRVNKNYMVETERSYKGFNNRGLKSYSRNCVDSTYRLKKKEQTLYSLCVTNKFLVYSLTHLLTHERRLQIPDKFKVLTVEGLRTGVHQGLCILQKYELPFSFLLKNFY